jgi:hypothetical protein
MLTWNGNKVAAKFLLSARGPRLKQTELALESLIENCDPGNLTDTVMRHDFSEVVS